MVTNNHNGPNWQLAVDPVPGWKPLKVQGVGYQHLETSQYDIYLTQLGWPLREWLMPEQHVLDAEWFVQNRKTLNSICGSIVGTGTSYKVQTKPVDVDSIDIVFKWNRMAQDVPGGDNPSLYGAEFNSPFQEFALAFALSNSRQTEPEIKPHRPLGIYSPKELSKPYELGRHHTEFERRQKEVPEVKLDPLRQYATMYEWFPGINAQIAVDNSLISAPQMNCLNEVVQKVFEEKGFKVLDHKETHIIFLDKCGTVHVESNPNMLGYVDFELLERI